MAQKSNMDLVENLKPFIAEIVQQQLGHYIASGISSNIISGDNIDVFSLFNVESEEIEHTIQLSEEVEIRKTLRIGELATFELWDPEGEIYRRIRITIKNGQPFLEFSAASDWSGAHFIVDFTVIKDYYGEVTVVSPNSLITLSNTSLPVSGWEMVNLEWEIELINQLLPVFYNEDPIVISFNEQGKWRIKLTITKENSIGEREANSAIRYLEVI